MPVHLHRAARTDQLADALGELLAVPGGDPFDTELVVVPAKGVERWLAQRLSNRLGAGPRGGDGVCAGVDFVSPGSLISLLLGRERDDVWQPDRLVWPLLEVIDASLGEPWCATLAAHLGHGVEGDEGVLRRNRRWSVARRLAGLFASYAVQRPSLIADWRAGRDADGADGPLDDDLRWQAELWRRLATRVGGPAPDERLAAAVTALQEGGDDLPLPGRVSLFGHTRLAVGEVELLAALGTHREVHLWLPQPSPELWQALDHLDGVVARDTDDSVDLVGHPLLASLGRDTRELRRALAPLVRGATDLPVAVAEPEPRSLLAWLQHDVRGNHAPTAEQRGGRVLAPGDASVQVHACHGVARQVDVLREVIAGLLEDDPTLEPRDVLVMCPDIETYAPLLAAGFGLADVAEDGHPAHRLRVRLADRSVARTNPLLGVALVLVGVAGGRATAPELLDLASRPPVRQRFRFGDDDLARIQRWVAESGIRWGLDAATRSEFAMSGFAHNTWRSGLDRVLLGAVMSGDDHAALGVGLPLDDVAGDELDLVGRLAEFVSRVERCVVAFGTASTASDWLDALREGVRSLTEVPAEDLWQLAQLDRELVRAADGEGEVALRLADVRALLESQLRARPTRSNFRTGDVTVATMVPMRSVPHRVVCLVGLDDGVFPRTHGIDGDDVLARRPLTGERDVRSEDRQLLLDAVLAATETLVITYTGANEHSGVVRPPAVPLGELLDALDRTVAEPVRPGVLRRHPLQPHDPRNFAAGETSVIAPRGPFSFDRAALAGAVAATGERRSPTPFLATALPPAPADDITLDELREFILHPVRAFLRRRLMVSTPLDADELADEIPIQLDALERWAVGDRLVREAVGGADPAAAMRAEVLRGTLPPGRLGAQAIEEIAGEVGALLDRTAELRTGELRRLPVEVDLGDGRRLVGTVGPVYGSKLVTVTYSRLRARQRMASWIDLVALSAAYPDEHFTAHAAGRHPAGVLRALAGPLDHRAPDLLRDLVALRELGLERPLPLPIATGEAWAAAHALELAGADESPESAATRAWCTDPFNRFGIEGEDADPAHVRVYGASAPLATLLDDGLASLAWRLWEPLVTGGERVAPL